MKLAIIILLSATVGRVMGQNRCGLNDLRKPQNTIVLSTPVEVIHKQVIAPDQYTQQLGFFCRQELHMQKAHVPVTFRLGSMDYCNRLEQKPGYR